MKLFYIENLAHRGNCRLWWRVDGKGYTCNLDDAWKVDKAQAEKICASREQDVARPAKVMEERAVRHVTR